MLHILRRLPLRHVVALIAVASLAAGCGGDVSPTSPGLPQGGPSFGTQSTSAVWGQLTGGGGSSSSAAFGAIPVASAMNGVQVSVQGTNITTTTNWNGQFLLNGVPTGTVVLVLSGNGTNATLTLQGVGNNQLVQIIVEVQANTATVVSQYVEELDEFEGDVDAIDTGALSFTLDGGKTIVTDATTWWDSGGDFTSFGALATAFAAGVRIEAEGRVFTTSTGAFLATVVKAETDDDDDGDEVEAIASSVDRAAFTITLVDGSIVVVDPVNTEWRVDGDYLSFASFADALEAGLFIEVEAEGTFQPDGSLLAAKIKATDDPLELEIEPDDWKLEWIGSGSPGSGGSAVEARLDDGPWAYILPSSVQMEGPDGVVTPFATEFELSRFEARFTRAQAISIAASVPEGEDVEITVRGTLTDGTPWELTDEVTIEEDDDDDDDDGKKTVSPEVAAEAIADIQVAIDYLNALVAAGTMAANDAQPLITKLQSAIASLDKLNGNPAVNQLGAFLNQLDSSEKTGKIPEDDAEFLEELIEDVIDLLEDDD